MSITVPQTLVNGICPYFTMFPLEFPLRILKKRAKENQSVLDPFCGRGTTNFAARLVGLNSLGIDSSPVATAITAAKLVQIDAPQILSEARDILNNTKADELPTGEFWEWAYHQDVLTELCQFRSAFLEDCSSPSRVALRGIILGALHGPRQKTIQSYLSNQNTRTFAPKPAYATRYWKKRNLLPSRVDILEIIERKAKRYFRSLPEGKGEVVLGDSREPDSFSGRSNNTKFSWVITSPPYYGMRTYIPDQWLRNWFIGGTDSVDYSCDGQVQHSNPENFVADIRKVWDNVAEVCESDVTLIVRFGGIADRKANPLDLAKDSFKESPWRLSTICNAGSAKKGRRQADMFLQKKSEPILEYDLWARFV